MKTIARSPACAAYAASDALVLPVDAQATARAPRRLACVMATVMPRSLNEPVGFSPSCLKKMRNGELGVGSGEWEPASGFFSDSPPPTPHSLSYSRVDPS